MLIHSSPKMSKRLKCRRRLNIGLNTHLRCCLVWSEKKNHIAILVSFLGLLIIQGEYTMACHMTFVFTNKLSDLRE